MSANPASGVVDAVERTLTLAQTWVQWDGKPRLSEEGDREYTPLKALRRQGDHIIDHLAEVDELLAGHPPMADEWQASAVTFPSEMAPFAQSDYLEAAQRLRRLARVFFLRYEVAGSEEWDRPREDSWTLREIADHLATAWYAEQIGDLTP